MSSYDRADTPAADAIGTSTAGTFPIDSTPALRFAAACSRVEADRKPEGIGTLGEKTLHAVLKYYYEPDRAFHEQKIGSYFADIAKDREVIEIQTRQLYRLKAKLSAFLSDGYQVTVVHPVPRHRWLYWIDCDGALSKRRKSPKTGAPGDAVPELSQLGDLLFHSGLTLRVILLDVEDFRNLNGWSKDKKKGSTRFERMPIALGEEIILTGSKDWRRLLPEGLPSRFTAKEFYKLGHYASRGGYYALRLFQQIGLIRKIGSQGRSFLFELTDDPSGNC